MKKRKCTYLSVRSQNPDCVWKPYALPLLKVASPFIRNFRVHVSYEADIPTDGSIIFAQNHTNFYDSLVFDKALLGHTYWCFASDEPRGTISGLSFESKGVVWLNRDSKDSRSAASRSLTELLKRGENLSWCPEGTWNLSEHRLMLPLSRGMAKVAIEAAKAVKVYIVPVVLDYRYRENSAKVREAFVSVCRAVPVSAEADAATLTVQLEDIFWTERWNQLEAAANAAPNAIEMDGKVFRRRSLSKAQWDSFIAALCKQYKTDWQREADCVIQTPEQRLQADIQKYINPKADNFKEMEI